MKRFMFVDALSSLISTTRPLELIHMDLCGPMIMFVDALSSLISKASNDRIIHGVRASRGGLEISHLFFVDDSLLFARANRQECATIVDILNKYEAASDQKINIDKSKISFSKRVSSVQEKELTYFMVVKQEEKHQKYLGIPTIAGRSKKKKISEIQGRIWKKLQEWKEKLLSRAGK